MRIVLLVLAAFLVAGCEKTVREAALPACVVDQAELA